MNKKYFTLVVIFLTLFTGVVIQSCQTDDVYNNNYEQKAALNDFKQILIKNLNTNDFQKLQLKRNKLIQNKSANLKKDLNNLETKVKSDLGPLLKGSRNFLHSKGITDNQLIAEFGSVDSPQIILSSIFLFAKDNEKQKKDITLSSIFKLQTANAENWLNISDHAYSCLSAAVGVTALVSLYENTMSLAGFETAAAAEMTTAETFALVKKIGGRYLGWFAVGAMVYEFTECYYGF